MAQQNRETLNINNRLLVVGGTGRDVGKTEFICRLIQKISTDHPVYALKVSSIVPDEDRYHGNHSVNEPGLHLFEETSRITDKDTSRMLRAGAVQVFYLRTDSTNIQTSFDDFLTHIPDNAVVICESNSLGQFVRPAISIMVKPLSGEIKPRAVAQLECADLVVVSDGKSGFPELGSIVFSAAIGWEMQGKSRSNP